MPDTTAEPIANIADFNFLEGVRVVDFTQFEAGTGLVPQKFRIPISFTLPPFQTREGFSRLASNVCVVDCRSH